MNISASPYFFYILTLAALWILPWKGVALWRSARNADKLWFIILLLINTLGILEIIYIFFFSKRKGNGQTPNQL